MNAQRSPFDIVTDLVSLLPRLVQKEMQLAKAEAAAAASQAQSGLIMLGAGAVLLIPALVVVLFAVAELAIANGMETLAAYLLVGGVSLAIGAILVSVGLSRMKATNLVPERTIDQLQRDAAVARQQL